MYCSRCGESVKDGAKFCGKCGNDVKKHDIIIEKENQVDVDNNTETKKKRIKYENVRKSKNKTIEYDAEKENKVEGDEAVKTNSKLFIFIVVVLILMILGTSDAAFWFLGGKEIIFEVLGISTYL